MTDPATTPRAEPTRFEDCGTERAYWRHAKRREQADPACLDAHAVTARQRAHHKRGAPAHEPAPCGTAAAYRRHRYHGEAPDRTCVDAHTRAGRIRTQAAALAAAIFPDTGT